MLWHDFCIPTKTLSLPKRNTPVIWIPNDKETNTLIGIWKCDELSSKNKNNEKFGTQSQQVDLGLCVVATGLSSLD